MHISDSESSNFAGLSLELKWSCLCMTKGYCSHNSNGKMYSSKTYLLASP